MASFYKNFLSEIASHGYLAIAIGPPQAPRPAGEAGAPPAGRGAGNPGAAPLAEARADREEVRPPSHRS